MGPSAIVAVLRLSQVIGRPVADVFQAIVDVESFPRWNPTTKSARKLSHGQTGEGTRFELAIRGFGRTTQELMGFERDRRVTLVPRIKAMSGGHTFVLTPEGDGRTRVDHELEMKPRGPWKAASRNGSRANSSSSIASLGKLVLDSRGVVRSDASGLATLPLGEEALFPVPDSWATSSGVPRNRSKAAGVLSPMDGPSRTLAPFGLGVLLAACSFAPPPPPRPSGPVVVESEAADPLKGLSGRIAFISHGTAGLVGLADDVFVLDLSTGRKRALTETAGVEWHPDWSPDGSLIAFDRLRDPGRGSWEAGFDIHVMAADGSGIRNLTRTPGLDWLPDWSPDGDRIAFISGRDGNLELYTMRADGTGQIRLTRTTGFESTPRWSPDGERIVYAVQGDIGSSLWVMDGDGTGARRITDDPGLNDFPAWSPDGQWIVFVSDRDSDSEGGFDLYRIRPDGSAVQRLTTGVRVDRYAAWSPDGRWIVYAATPEGASALYVMPAEGGPVRQLTPPGSLRCCPSWIDEG